MCTHHHVPAAARLKRCDVISLPGRVHHTQTAEVAAGEGEDDAADDVDDVVTDEDGERSAVGVEVAVHEERDEEATQQHRQPDVARSRLKRRQHTVIHAAAPAARRSAVPAETT